MSHLPKIGGQPVLEESSDESSSSDDDKSGILSPQKAATRDNLAQAEVRRFDFSKLSDLTDSCFGTISSFFWFCNCHLLVIAFDLTFL